MVQSAVEKTGVTVWFRSFFRAGARLAKHIILLGFFAMLLSFAGCAGTPTDGRALHAGTRITSSSSLYGNYLAARFAGSIRDIRNAATFYQRALARDPDNNIILERAFLLEVADGQIREAVALGREVVARDGQNRLARLVLGIEAFRKGDYAAARQHLARSRQGPISSLIRDLVTAWSHIAEGEKDSALAVLDRGAAESSFATFYVINRALINDFAAETEIAAADYLEALRITGGRSVRVVQGYGALLERRGQKEEAEALYRAFLKRSPDNPLIEASLNRLRAGRTARPLIASAQQGLAEAIYGPSDYLVQERAIDLPILYLQLALYLHPRFDVARSMLGDLFDAGRRWEDAMRAYAGIPRNSSLYEKAQIRIAFDLDRLERTDEAVAVLKALVRRDPQDAQLWVALGDMLRMRSRFEEAARAYGKAIETFEAPEEYQWLVYYSRGISFERTGQWAQAEKDFLTAIDLSPDQPLVLNYLGYSWIDQGKNQEKAMRLIQQAVDLSPDDGFIVDSLGWAFYQQGKYEEAVIHLERAVALEPTDPVINEHLGDAYWRVGRRLEARFQWRHALAMNESEDLEQEQVLKSKLENGLDPVPTRGAALSVEGGRPDLKVQ